MYLWANRDMDDSQDSNLTIIPHWENAEHGLDLSWAMKMLLLVRDVLSSRFSKNSSVHLYHNPGSQVHGQMDSAIIWVEIWSLQSLESSERVLSWSEHFARATLRITASFIWKLRANVVNPCPKMIIPNTLTSNLLCLNLFLSPFILFHTQPTSIHSALTLLHLPDFIQFSAFNFLSIFLFP